MITQRQARKAYREVLQAVAAYEQSLGIRIQDISITHVRGKPKVNSVRTKDGATARGRNNPACRRRERRIADMIAGFETLSGFTVVNIWVEARDTAENIIRLTVTADGADRGDFQVL